PRTLFTSFASCRKVSAMNLARSGSPGIRTVLAKAPWAASLWGVPMLSFPPYFSSMAFTALTMRLVPRREAPRLMKSSASFRSAMPPAALIFTSGPTCFAKRATSSRVAPPVPKP
ncbi:hypothetical protein KMBAHK_KMBAHK_13960, partial [Dysosmobacter welbionis]